MSLVGTRPPTVDEWDKYELHHRARLATKPGLTGMWQGSGRSNITDFEEVVKLDASQGIGLFEKLNELYAEYGYCLNTLHSYTFEGSAGFEKMQNIMVSFRKSITEFAGKKVLKCLDYTV